MATKKISGGGTIVQTCTCKNEFQDKTYGSGNRVMNVGVGQVSCTVCGKDYKG